MNHLASATETDRDRLAAAELFARSLGLPDVESVVEPVGNEEFLKFRVGRHAPLYDHALRETLKSLPDSNLYRGLLGLQVDPTKSFPDSLEAKILRGLLVRTTRTISGHASSPIQYVPFRNNEDTQAIQPANHLIVGRRGVGKSTLIQRAVELLEKSNRASVVLDMQPYGHRPGDEVLADVLGDLSFAIAKAFRGKHGQHSDARAAAEKLEAFAGDLLAGKVSEDRASAALRRHLSQLTSLADADLCVFLDDYHLVDTGQQPRIVEAIHGGLKGARGWLKVAGLKSLLKVYDPRTKKGLQIPGDAQMISLDLTLTDPEAAEKHLRLILENLLKLVGVDKLSTAIADLAFHRLVWANAGVPRDFLQVFARSIEQACRASRKRVELTDANLAIGESGQRKLEELEEDARNEKNFLKKALDKIEQHCLEEKKVNAFLIRSEPSDVYRAVQTLSDLRLLHLLHATITPHRAGERYEAYMLDYSLFTGFRRRPNIKQMLPSDKKQFKAAELRRIPILPKPYNL